MAPAVARHRPQRRNFASHRTPAAGGPRSTAAPGRQIEAPLPPPAVVQPAVVRRAIGIEAAVEPPVAAQPMAVEPNSAQESPPGPDWPASRPAVSSPGRRAVIAAGWRASQRSTEPRRDVRHVATNAAKPRTDEKVLQGAGGSAESVDEFMKLLPGAGSAAGGDVRKPRRGRLPREPIAAAQDRGRRTGKRGDDPAPAQHPRANIARCLAMPTTAATT